MRVILLICTLSFFFSCSSDENEKPTTPMLEAASFIDISYGENDMQKYDVYLPANRTSTSTKVVVLVHGGGWIEGDKSDMNGYVQLIQQRNKDYAIVNINYVLADENNKAYPNQIQDIQAVIDDIKSKSSEYQIQPKFGFIGVSAGAHLSLLYSYAFDTEQNVEMVCSVVGPTDFTDSAYLESTQFRDAFSVLVDDFSIENRTQLEEISPSYQVSSTSPPTILFYGNADPLIPNFQHQSLKTSLENANTIHAVTIFNGGHGDWDTPSYLELDATLNTFLDTHL